MSYTLKIKPSAQKIFEKLDKFIQKRIAAYLYNKVVKNPRKLGKALSANYAGYWHYRIGDYRVICEIKDKELIIFVLEIGHRSEIYEK